MTTFHARIHVSADGSLTGQIENPLLPGDYDVRMEVPDRVVDRQGLPANVGDEEAQVRSALEISDWCSKLPILDDRPADEILGYDEAGAFKPW